MNELSLFTGAGGGVLGTMLCGHIPIGYVEWNPYCQRVIAQRIKDGILPVAPVFTDVHEFVKSGAAEQYRGFADLVTAGFPCQPFSVAGKQLADADDRFCNIREIAMAKFSASPAIRERYKDWQTRDWADFERDGYRVARFKLVECAEGEGE